MKKIVTIGCLIFLFIINTHAQLPAKRPLSQQLALTAMHLWKDSFSLKTGQPAKWSYDQGVILKGIEGIWNATGDGNWFNYLQQCIDFYVQNDGTIKGYKPDEYNIDHLNNGKIILLLYRVTGKEKYKKAADLLRNQLKNHPRNTEGSFWHKKIYPNQVWLDGLYMGQPFYAEYAKLFNDDTAFNDITRQFIQIEKNTADAKSGLLYHAWDESRTQKWADKVTGKSPHVWGRALGWYGMALVDVLDYFPPDHPGKQSLINILNRFTKAVVQVQDKKTGLWYDIPDKPNESKNYVEASASSMLVYTIAKGIRKGYLPASYQRNALRAYEGIVKRFIKKENGHTNLHGTVSVSGLGGNPYRDGSFSYYMSEPVIVNDPKGMGAFIKAAVEVEMIPGIEKGKNKNVLLDYYYNNEWKKDSNGNNIRHHYTWDDRSNGGFFMFGEMFQRRGAQINFLPAAPSVVNLKQADIYIIVDPDTDKEATLPNLMNEVDAGVISSWVKEGGVLLILTNDAGNAELTNFNKLATKFGIRFNEDHYNLVQGNMYDQGAIIIPASHAVFKKAKKIYVKELSTLEISKPAIPLLTKEGKHIMAMSRYGKGTVLAIGDPWLYNEYIDGRKLPEDFDNYESGNDLVTWALGQVNKTKK